MKWAFLLMFGFVSYDIQPHFQFSNYTVILCKQSNTNSSHPCSIASLRETIGVFYK
jgi:hypothetical protein